jgi:hypothetical protein
MSSLTSLSDLVQQLTTSGVADVDYWYKSGLRLGAAPTAPVVGRWTSLWLYDGNPGGASAVPGTTPELPTNTTTGTIDVDPAPTGGKQRWLLSLSATGLTSGTVLLYDRLMQQGGLSGTVTGAQAVSGILTRYNNNSTCLGNQIWAEIYTAVGATGTTITATYKNQANVLSTTQPVTFGGTGFNEQGRMIQLPLAAGDSGVQQVVSCTIAASTLTAGSYGITVGHPLTYVYLPLPGVGGARDLISGAPGIVEIMPNACLSLAWLAGTTTVPQLFGYHVAVDK